MPNAVIGTAEDERALSVQDFVLYLEQLEEHVDINLLGSLKKMLECQTPEERSALATKMLAEDQTGLAHLFLALDSDVIDKRKQHYENALELSKKHDDQNAQFRYVFGHGASQLANLLWRLQQREEAILVLENAQTNTNSFGQQLVDEIRYSLITYLIVQNSDERARAILDQNAVPTLEWFYLNALLRFRQLGDSFISRGALNRSLSEDELIAYGLSDTEYDDDEDEHEELDQWEKNYIELTRQCWNETPHAMSWLTKSITRLVPRVGFSETKDQRRSRRVESEFELALSHSERTDLKSAKRSFNSALKEANRLNDGGTMLLFIAEMYAAFLEVNEESQSPIIEVFKQRVTWLDSQAASAEPEALMNSYLDIARVFLNDFADPNLAEILALKAYDIFNKIRSESDTHTGGIILAILGSTAAQKDNFTALESYARAGISTTEETFGSTHLDLVGLLQFLRYSLHNQGKHEEEINIAKRVYELDLYADKDEEFEKLEWCQLK